jgi:hypothetical protein
MSEKIKAIKLEIFDLQEKLNGMSLTKNPEKRVRIVNMINERRANLKKEEEKDKKLTIKLEKELDAIIRGDKSKSKPQPKIQPKPQYTKTYHEHVNDLNKQVEMENRIFDRKEKVFEQIIKGDNPIYKKIANKKIINERNIKASKKLDKQLKAYEKN